jgi:hypothetical protein
MGRAIALLHDEFVDIQSDSAVKLLLDTVERLSNTYKLTWLCCAPLGHKAMSPPMVHLALLQPASCMLKDLDKGQCLQLEEGHLHIVD